MTTRRLLLASGLSAWAACAWAAAPWPTRALRLVVPFPPGSSPDLIARMVSEPLARALGQPVVVENKPGAGGNIGTAAVAHAAPDGSTWLFTIQGPLVTAPLLTASLPYDPLRDLAPVSLIATSPNVLVVDARLGVDRLDDFLRLARARAGALNYGSVGRGSAAHLAMEGFMRRSGLQLMHVPYSGFPQVVQALLAGDVQAAFMVPGIAMPQVRAGKLKALGVTTLGRVASLPELPTLAEQGHAGFEAISWQSVLAPATTPREYVERMSRELVRILRSDELRARMLGHHFTAVGTVPEGLANLMRSERARWAQVIRDAGLKPE
jgi:tripartite-type tricarboxylate transporter receptor subunit TctC